MVRWRRTLRLACVAIAGSLASCSSSHTGSAPVGNDPQSLPSVPLVKLFDDGVLYGIAADGRVFGGPHLTLPASRLDGALSIAGRSEGWVILGSAPTGNECAALANGDVLCRGSNVDDDLGTIATTSCDNPNNACPPPTQENPYCFRLFGPTSYPCVRDWTLLPGVRDLIQLHESCGVDRQGQIVCWGRGLAGSPPRAVKRLAGTFAILDDDTLFDRTANALVAGVSNVVDADGGDPACAVESDGALYCWGKNTFGLVGDGTTTDRADPIKVGDGFASVHMRFTACGVMKDGGLSCWGASGSDANAPGVACAGFRCVVSPTRIEGLVGVVQVTSSGFDDPVVLTSDGRVLQTANLFTKPTTTVVHP